MTISDTEMTALCNLADKRSGKDVGWISISDARALTELGLARRNREGWEITPEGVAMVEAAKTPPQPADAALLTFTPKPRKR